MKVIAINGSPRKTWNTATLLNKALEGAASRGAGTELIHLMDIEAKATRRREVFPADCRKAYEMDARFAR